MITKAFIKSVLPNNPYKYNVRIPIYENSASKSLPNGEYILEAVVCYSPGTIGGFKEGDCVFVSFEDNDNGRPIILGKLYRGNEPTPSSYFQGDSLNVQTVAHLPSNTSIGSIPANKFQSLLNVEGDIQAQLDALKSQVFNLQVQIAAGGGGGAPKTYTVTLVGIGGADIDVDLSYLNGTLNEDTGNYEFPYNYYSLSITLPTPSRTDYVFMGWEDSNGNVAPSVVIAQGSYGNKSYTAKWAFRDELTLSEDGTLESSGVNAFTIDSDGVLTTGDIDTLSLTDDGVLDLSLS